MRVLELSLSGFGSYSQETSLDLSNVGVCAVTGHNGAGKSTLFDAILWALYGTVPGRKIEELVNEDGGPARVHLAVDVAGQRHEFVRERSLASSKSAMAEYTSPRRGTISGAKPVAVEAERLLNVSRDLLILTAMSRQHDSGRLGSMDSGTRRSVLAGALLGGLFDEPLQIAEEAKMRTATEAAKATRDVDNLLTQAAMLEEAQDALERAEGAAKKSSGVWLRLSKAESNAANARERLQRAERRERQLERARQDLTQAERDAAAAQEEVEALDAAVNEAEESERTAEAAAEKAAGRAVAASNKAAAAQQAAAGADERIEMLARGDGECDICGAELSVARAQDRIQEQERLLSEEDSAHKASQRATTESRTKQREEKSARASVRSLRSERTATLKGLEGSRERVAAAQRLLDDADAEEPEDVEALKEQVRSAPGAAEVAAAKSADGRAQRQVGSCARQVEITGEAADALPASQEKASLASDRARGAELLKLSLGHSGLPHLALETGVQRLATATNEALASLGQIQIRFLLEDPSKANPPLGIQARYGWSKGWRSYSTFSGGERMQIDISLRIGLTRVIGGRCRTMILDEGWGALDAQSAASLARLLLTLIRSGSIDAFYTISHVPGAVDEFDHRIEVSRGLHGSSAMLVRA